MPTGPTGAPPNSPNATTRERTVIDELYRVGNHAAGPRKAGAIKDGLSLILDLIATRQRRTGNGYFDQRDADD